MKKKNWLMTIAFAVLALTIVSTCVIGSTYAKFTKSVTGGAKVQAAGFLVAGSTTPVEVTGMIAPGESVTAQDVTINYFSQVATLISTSTLQFAGTGVFDQTAPNNGTSNWAQLIAAYNTKYSASVAYTLADLFDIKIAGEADIAKAFAAAVVAHSTGTSAVTAMDSTTGNGYTGYVADKTLNPMAKAATDAVNVQFNVTVTWKNNYVTGGTAEQNAAEMDRFDTFVGNYIYNMLHASTGEGAVFNATTSTTSTITVTLPITATQLAKVSA